MGEPLKNLFKQQLIVELAAIISRSKPDFDEKAFLGQVFSDEWEGFELKERARHISMVLNRFLWGSYEKDLDTLLSVISEIQHSPHLNLGIVAMCIPDYVEVFGLEEPNLSLKAMEKITTLFSCEFAIRPFLLRYPEKALSKMLEWAEHPHEQVRRLSSEGCRPRLPWGVSIPYLKKDPAPIIPILSKLRSDPSETVRLSVANNLNDISKDNPEIVITLTRKWLGQGKDTDWVLKHGCRTLLKSAYPGILPLFGYANPDSLRISDFEVSTPRVSREESLVFKFSVENTSDKELLVRLEYGMYFLKANGSHSKKVFKISERTFEPGQRIDMERRQSFRPISTRKYYPGLHLVSLIVNGFELKPIEFTLET